MLHVNTNIGINAKINSRGNKEQHSTISGNKTIWGGGSLKAKRKGVIITGNDHLTKRNHTSVNYFEFY